MWCFCMMIAPSRKNKEILHDIEPMKNVFMAMFFISVGMEIGLGTLIDNIGLTLIFLVMFVVLKVLAVFFGYWLANENARDSFSSAVSFLAMGEFAFIIAKQALDYNVFTQGIYTSIVGAALLSMITLPLISKDAAERWDWAASRMPGKILRSMKALDNIKVSFYARIALASKRTRKEIGGSMNRSYYGMIFIVMVELIFTLITPPLREWGIEYFGGTDWTWNFMILLLNLVVLYAPVFWTIESVKTVISIADRQATGTKTRREHNFVDRFVVSNSWMIALMVTITILIIVPNGLDIWEHIVVLLIALVFLLYINRRSVTMKVDLIPFEDEGPDYMDEESFRQLLDQKYAKKFEEEKSKTVSIDTGDRKE